MGIFESTQRSQQNIDELAGGLRNYLTQKRDNDYKQFMYGKIRELTQPQTTTTTVPDNSQPVPSQIPRQTQAAPRQNMNAPIQPMQPAPMVPQDQIPTKQQTNTRTLSKREALRAYLSNNPPQSQEEWNAVKQYADMLDITEPKSETFTAARGSGIFQRDANGNVTQVGRVPEGEKMIKVARQNANGDWEPFIIPESERQSSDRDISMFSAGEKQIKVARNVNGKLVPLVIKESEKQPGDEDVSAFTQDELNQRLEKANQNRITVKQTAGGANAGKAWESEKSAILKATKNSITEEDWDKPYSEVRSKLRGLGSTPTERENRWYKAHQLKSKAEVSGQIEQPKPGTPAPQVAVDPNDPMGILK